MRSLWIAELAISDRTADEIRGRHHIEPDEVRQVLVCVPGLEYAWHEDEVRGERALVAVAIRGRPALAGGLYEAEHALGDVWNLGSVYFVDV